MRTPVMTKDYSVETVPYDEMQRVPQLGNPNFILYGMHKKREKFYIKKIEKKKCKVKIYLTGN